MGHACRNDKKGIGSDLMDLIVDVDGTAPLDAIDQYVLGDSYFALPVVVFSIGIKTHIGDVEIRYERIVQYDLPLFLRQDKAAVTVETVFFTGPRLPLFTILFHTARLQDYTTDNPDWLFSVQGTNYFLYSFDTSFIQHHHAFAWPIQYYYLSFYYSW